MVDPPTFSAEDAEAEVQRIERTAKRVVWDGPAGTSFTIDVPPTVYPPRQDTFLLADALRRLGLSQGSSCLEIGCGSGAVSYYAASLGLRVTSCDTNPYAVACTSHHAQFMGYNLRVNEGGPGPQCDGLDAQWGGDQHYDVVMWNLPYLPPVVEGEATLGPFEESALLDNDSIGLYVRLLKRIESGGLLKPKGVGLFVVSDLRDGQQALEQAWHHNLAAREMCSHEFENGELLRVVAIWRPFENVEQFHFETVDSTNEQLLGLETALGSRLTASVQSEGRGRKNRSWDSQPGALAASWVVDDGGGITHSPIHQLWVGWALTRFFSHASMPNLWRLKWPNDVYLRSSSNTDWKKCGGILFEGKHQGVSRRVVLGIGMNLAAIEHNQYGSIQEVCPSLELENVCGGLHAIIASLFEIKTTPHVPNFDLPIEHLNDAISEGVASLGPLLYRELGCGFMSALNNGSISVQLHDGATVNVDEPNDLFWSNIQDSIED